MNNKPTVRLRSLQVGIGTRPKSYNVFLHGSATPPCVALGNRSMRCSTSPAVPPASMHSKANHQSGVVLIISLIMLLLLTLISTSGMQTTSLEEKMAGNMRDKNLAFQAAESALKTAETSLNSPPTFTDAGTNGFYTPASTIPTASAILADTFWTTNPVATSTVTGLGNGITTPVYIIQDTGMVADCPGSAIGSLGCKYYRITTRATGGSTNAVVILQSIYLR